MKIKPPTHTYLAARRLVFSRGITRRFAEAAAPLFTAVEATREAIKAASTLDDIPPFTDIAVQYGALLTRALLLSFVKGSDSARKRKYRKNSINLDEIVEFSWTLENTAAVAAFSREAFEMAAVQTQELRDTLFADARQVFASGGSYRDWADSFSLYGFEPDNPYHLRTNYDTAANAAYAAGQWEQFEALKDIFPWLRYVTMRDEKVREEHAALDGLVYKVDDIFWLTYMPPNGWNCRCGVEQLMEDEYDPATRPQMADKPLNIPPEFQNNPGISRQLLYQDTLQNKVNALPMVDAGDFHYPISKYPPFYNTDNLSISELMDLCAKYLGDRFIYDPNKVPLALPAVKSQKFKNKYDVAELRKRFKYLRCIDDAITSPNEVWLNPESKHLYYLKRYADRVVVIAEIEADNQIRYFDIMKNSGGGLDNLRKGILVYKQ